jgi:hypothetical protein
MIKYPALDEAIKEFPNLRFFPPGRCAKCGISGSDNIFITSHHIFPDRHWEDNCYKLPLCMRNGKKNGNDNSGQRSCHDLIEREIKAAEKGKRMEPRKYCQLTEAFLNGGSEKNDENYLQGISGASAKPPTIKRPLNGFHRGGI